MYKFLGDLEEKVMKIIWDSKVPLKPQQVKKALNNRYAYTTISTTLLRLNNKGILVRKKEGKAYFYKATKERDTFIKPKLKKVFQNLIKSYGELAISQFVDVLDTIDSKETKKHSDEKH